MITRQQVEAYADELIELTEVDLAKITLEDAVLQVADLLAPLSPRERDAVIKCADEIRTIGCRARGWLPCRCAVLAVADRARPDLQEE